MFETLKGSIEETFSDAAPDQICLPCLAKGLAEGLVAGFAIGAITALALTAIAAFSVPLAIGAALALAFYGGMQIGQAIVNMKGMSDQQKSEQIGILVGSIPGAILGGRVVGGVPVAEEPALSPAENQAAAQNFYNSNTDWSPEKIDSHLEGIDFSKPVDPDYTIPKGTNVVQYQVPGRPTGRYFAPVGTPPEELGIDPTGRVAQVYTTTEDITVLKSTAADTTGKPGIPASAQGKGGGTQFFTPDSSKFQAVP